MKITFLGTGTSQGVPMIGCSCEVCVSTDKKDKRLRTSIAIELEGQTLVIDTGPDFRYQMLRSGIKTIDAVLFTHGHKDHTAGLDDIRAFNYFQKKAIDVFADLNTGETLKKEFSYIFSGVNYPGIPQINLKTITNSAFTIGNNILIEPFYVLHYKLPVLGFKINDFVYITDANFITEEIKEKINGCSVLVINALRHEKHISHFTLEEAIEIAKEVNAKQTYFIHLSHQMGLYKKIDGNLPTNCHLSYDELILEL